MKSNTVIVLLVSLFSFSALADGLKRISDHAIEEAVEEHYEMGRWDSDSGGIADIKIYRNNNGLSTFQIVKEIMVNHSDAGYACTQDFDNDVVTNGCVRRVLTRNPDVMSNYQFNDVMAWIDELEGWEMGGRWALDLDIIRQGIIAQVGENFKTYSFGYDDVADVWVNILISRDKKTILVVGSDYGA